MKSYATIGKIQQDLVECEVEMIKLEDSKQCGFYKETKRIKVDIRDNMFTKIWFILGKLEEGDIVVVEHNGYEVIKIYYKDNAERKRRNKVLKSVMR